MAIEQVPLRDQAYSLSPAQYGSPVHQPDEPLPVTAWIQTRTGHYQVDGVAVAWTPKAARIRYADDHGREGYAWVWANAVRRR
ncbi:hypothetical protein [Georgenia alba]|uniref:YD repeat-containing protein n=1 Tax=Georgenia alba TaxID=2233858 RepID=A0ABW2Q469_9MICO